ncbi:putative N-acetyltransferase YsnE [Carnimonas sp. R-84981]|uniref:GNAT family N-acetyltransferase n=2 Tax=Carnimonas bestiolae TaxID=3402172 RepID=UPI003EDCAAC4
MHIQRDDLTHPAVIALIEHHLNQMAEHSPPESKHALAVEHLRQPEITFWSLWSDEGELMGCCGMKALDEQHGEIKSMKTAPDFLRQGVASALMTHLVEEARRRGYRRISLETGTPAYFLAAHHFYQRHGFEDCEPFANYQPDPFSRFMTLPLA